MMEEILSRRALDYFSCVLDAKEPDYPYITGMQRARSRRTGKGRGVYVLGAKEPLLTFEGKVIAVWHRFDDSEDKWIVSLNGEAFREEVILGIFHFRSNFLGKMYR